MEVTNIKVTNDFYGNLENLKPIFYHWLDGLLDPNVGNTKINTRDNIIKLPINVISDSTIKISMCETTIVDEENNYLTRIGILSTTIKTKLNQFCYIDFPNEKIVVTEFDEENKIHKKLEKKPEELLTWALELFEFNIIQVQDETHAISFLTFVKSNELYVCIINSGKGIESNPFVKIPNSQYYSPHQTYLVCDNIRDNKKLNIGIKKIFSLVYFSIVYDDLIRSLIPVASNTFAALRMDTGVRVVSDKTIEMLKFVAKNCPNVLTFEYGDIKLAQLLGENQVEFQETPAFKKSFYLMCTELMPTDQCKLTISKEFKNEINSLNKNMSILKPTPKLDTNIIDKMIFKVVNEELCILSQESGSCSWYSVYWALLMYYIYYQPDYQKYISFITQLNRYFYTIITDIFSPGKIKYMYLHESFIPWKIFLGLFCEIGLLDITLLESANECLFNLKHKVEFEKINWNTTYDYYPDINNTADLVNVSLKLKHVIKNILQNNISNASKPIEINSKMMFTSIINFYNDVKLNISIMSNTFFYLCFKFFQLNQSTGVEFYKGFNANLCLGLIKKLREKLSKISKENIKFTESNKNKIIKSCFNFLEANVNKLSRVIGRNMHIYEYYHISTFFLPHDSSEDEITSFAKFISATITATRIYLVLLKFLYLVKLHTADITALFNPVNELINRVINGGLYDVKYLPVITVNEFEKFISDYSYIFKKFDPENTNIDINIDFFKFNSNYLMINTKYEFNTIEFDNIRKNNTYDDFIKERDYYFNNPQFIYSNYSDSDNVSQDIFIKIHIKHIANNFDLRKKLILYFGKKFVSYVSLPNYKIFLENTIGNLYLLIFLTDVDTSTINKKDKHKFATFDTENIFLKYNYGTIKYEFFYRQIYNLYIEKGPHDFPTFLANNFRDLTKSKINKFKEDIEHIYPQTVVSGNILKINGLQYDLADPNNFNFIEWFNTSSSELTNSKQPVVYRIDEKNLCEIIFIRGTHVIKITGLYNNNNYDKKLEITNIKIDESICVKNSEIKYPFKYVIPLSCNHLIYESGTSYNVLYFASNYQITKNDKLLFENKLEPQIIEIPINENNMLYPRIGHFNIFKRLCENYQVRPLNIIFTNDEYELTCKPNNKIDKKYNWDKREFLTGNIQAKPVDLVQLLNQVSEPDLAVITTGKESSNTGIDKLIKLLDLTNSKFDESIKKLINKTEFCRVVENNIAKTIEHLEKLKLCVLEKISVISKLYSQENIHFILSSEHYNYLQLVKTSNIVNMLLNLIEDEQQFCSQLKILRELLKTRTNNYNYNFPIVFETFVGNELLEEQQNRFNSIIENYNGIEENKVAKIYSNYKTDIINYYQTGGHIYPLHHFMMGKGKSAIMTPMLMLYFSLIANKTPYIIVPEHLVLETKNNMDEYKLLFCIKSEDDKTNTVFSGSEIKNLFLSGHFLDPETNANKVFIIDEFDSLLDPTKSNYNIVENKPIDTKHLYEFIKKIVYSMSESNLKEFNPSDAENLKPFDSKGIITETSAINIIKDINQIYKNIQADTFVENINWGISRDNFLAVPYLNKDKPIANSNFSSCVITIFLTLYYYVILNKLQVTELIIKCIIEKKLFSKIFKTNEPVGNTRELVIKLINDNPEIKTEIFSVVFDEIFYSLTLAREQINVSFVDIINIDSIYKIGYSGTVNLELPKFLRTDNIFEMSKIIVDPDESVNVLYALVNGTTFTVNQIGNHLCLDYIRKLNEKLNLKEYDAFIDQAGIFKNIINKEVAKCFQEFFNFSRDIIFMSETDKKYVLSGTHDESNYYSGKKYLKPFIYYSQGHVIGVDIRQDYLPKMKGLVTINSKSIYTNVAQAVFRLRKLNLGHTVDILYVGNENEILTSVDICEIIRCNEEKQKTDKSNLLAFQTLKSEIRKEETKKMLDKSLVIFNGFIKDQESQSKPYNIEKILTAKNTGDLKQFNKIYKEKIKYYFIDEFPTTGIKYLDGIVKPIGINFDRLFSKINNVEILKKLVFSIDSDCSNITIEKESEKEVVKVKEVSNTIFNENQYNIPTLEWDYIQYYFCNLRNKDIFNRITYPINKIVSCVPNICTHFNGFTFEKNNSGLLWVLIPEMEKLLLVPGYMGPIFGFEYVLLNIKDLSLLNHNMFTKFIKLKELIDKLSQNELVKFIHTGIDFYLTKQNNYTQPSDIKNAFVLFIILTNLTNKLAPHVEILKILNNNQTLYSDFNGLLKIWSSNKYLRQIIIPHVTELETLDPFIRTDEEYKCNINVSKFNEFNQNLEKECENNKSKFKSNIQSQTQLAENKLLDICNKYKIEYQNHTNCNENKQIFFDAGNIKLCHKNQVEYINLEIIKNNNLISQQTQEIIKANEKITDLNKKIRKLTKPIRNLEKEIADLKEENKKTDGMDKKQRQKFKDNIREKITLIEQSIEKEKKLLAKSKEYNKLTKKFADKTSEVKQMENKIKELNIENKILESKI